MNFINRHILSVRRDKRIEYQHMQAPGDIPFNGKYMIMGGFTPMLSYHQSDGSADSEE